MSERASPLGRDATATRPSTRHNGGVRRIVPLLALLAVTVAGCGAVPDFPVVQATATMTDGSTSVGRWYDVEVTAGDSPVRIAGAAFFTPYFATTDGVAVDQTLAAGEAATITLPVGAAECPAGQGPSTVQLVLEVDGGEVLQSVEVEGDALLERHASECGQAAITAAISHSFGPILAAEPLAVRTTLLLVRVSGSDAATVDAIEGSEQFRLTADQGALPAELVRGAQRLEVPVTIEAARCDGLPFGGATTAFAFTIVMRSGDGEAVRVSLRPEGALLAALEDIALTCDQASLG